jgi:hypothetical protein
LVSIATDIAYRSPRSYPVCAAIISKCLSALDSDDQRHGVAMAVLRRFRQLPNTGQMEIWLQRISMKCCPDIDFLEPLCRLVQGHATGIWNSEWLHVDELRQAVDAQRVFDPERAAAMDPVVTPGEVELFTRRGWYY